MKRRDAIKVMPLSLTGLMSIPGLSHALGKKPLALQYNAKVRAMLERIKHTQSEEMLEVSWRAAQAKKGGHKCFVLWDMGHSTSYDFWPDRPGDTDIFQKGIPQEADKKDLILANCYHQNLEKFHKKGVFIAGGPRPWGGDVIGSELLIPRIRKMKVRPFADLWIETFITAYGAIMNIPGETTPMAPVSGVIGMMTFWMMVSDAARLLAAARIPFKVFGDEPSLKKGSVNVDMARPLGDVYYDHAMTQLKAIDGEIDTINRIASMAVHSVLNGGRVYVYSSFTSALCAEGTVRRGGLGLTFGISGSPDDLVLMDDPIQRGKMDLTFKPTDKDMVIMGIIKPDDPDDLQCLDLFRKAGMGVTAIGPATRNGKIPSGRTVPKEVDIHIGSGYDTYGLFALPGAKKKVAPTSGLNNIQNFWCVCLQIAEQIIERTGNTPRVYLSGALKGGMEKLDEVKRVLRERGY